MGGCWRGEGTFSFICINMTGQFCGILHMQTPHITHIGIWYVSPKLGPDLKCSVLKYHNDTMIRLGDIAKKQCLDAPKTHDSTITTHHKNTHRNNINHLSFIVLKFSQSVPPACYA